MTRSHDEDERLTMLLRALPIPEPPPDFLAGARRRYLEALDARYRREAFAGLVAAAVAFGLAAPLLRFVFEPAALITSIALTMANVTKWVDGVGIALSHVPPLVWPSAVVLSVVSLLAAISVLRVPVAVK